MDEGCYQLGDVEHRAAADAYYAVGLELAGDGEYLLEVVNGGLSHDVLIHLDGNARAGECGKCLLDERTDGGSGQHKEPAESHLLIIFC